ncbi:MAG TPA: fibronectin type III domain-containing protein [Acidimicrobiales bacterium]|nr:fibronectin type III domain-containing protein [Acidimicrobiales bacterium]
MIGDTARQRTAARVLGALLAVMGGAFLVLISASPVGATGTCSYSATTENIDITVAGEGGDVTLASTTGGALSVSGTGFSTNNCDGVALTRIGTIAITAPASTDSQLVKIDLTNGFLQPGNDLESTNSFAEIEITVDLRDGGADTVHVVGRAGVDKFVAGGTGHVTGATGVNLNAAEEGANADWDISTTAAVETLKLDGAGGNDEITGQGGGNLGSAAGNALTLVGGAGDDSLIGGDGPDTFDESDSNNGKDTMEGKAGSDTAKYDRSVGVTLTVDGQDNDGVPGEGDNLDVENLTGGDGNDTLSGTLTGATGVDSAADNTFNGDTGSDTVSYLNTSGGVTVDLGAADPQATGAGNDSFVEIDNLIGSTGNDTLTGAPLASNAIDGGPGNDTLNGGTLATGPDIFLDTVDYSSATTTAVTVSLALTTAQNTGGAGTDTLTASTFDNLRGSPLNDTLTGDGNDNVLSGGLGNDTLRGGAGRDTLNGDDGNDNVSGEAGDDIQNGGAGSDALDFTGRSAMTVDFSSSPQPTTTGDHDPSNDNLGISDTFTGIELVIGSGNNDTFKSGSTSDGIDGGGNGAVPPGDVLDYSGVFSSVTVDMSTGTASNHGNDTFTNVEKVIGSGANDRFISGNGNEILDGGGGTSDTIEYSAATTSVSVNLSVTAAQNTVGAGTDTLSGFENLTGSTCPVAGSTCDDTLVGTTGINILNGLDGKDSLSGDAENDTLIGGPDDDNLSGQGGSDTVDFSGSSVAVTVNLTTSPQTATGQGNDRLASVENAIGTSQPDEMIGDAGNNTFSGRGENDVLRGGDGSDTLNGEGGADLLIGGNSNDTLSGGDGDDVLRGGAGGATAGDSLVGGNHDTVGDTADYSDSLSGVTVSLLAPAVNTGDALLDTYNGVENVTGTNSLDTISGDGSANRLRGLEGNDTIKGGGGNDILTGDAGDDSLDGEGDTGDTADFGSATVGVTVNLGTTSPTKQNTNEGNDDFAGIENVTGSKQDDTLTGDPNANTLKGGDGDDTLKGAAGNDSLQGGAGTDKADYSGAGALVTVDLDNAAAQNTGGAGTDTLADLENLLGSDHNDVLTGDENANVIEGGAGNDTINGRLGDDTLSGDAATNTVSYAGAPSGVTVTLSLATRQNTGGAGNDLLSGFLHIIGSGHNDTLAGTAGDNQMDGGGGLIDIVSYANATGDVSVNLSDTAQQSTGAGGNDTLTGFEGVLGSPHNDTFRGTTGGNVVTGGIGADTVNYDNAGAGVRISLAETGPQDTEGAGTDTITQVENVVGSGSPDTLIGDGGSNVISGGNGDDNINGGDGNDTESGGAGNDTFSQGTSMNGADTMSGGSGTDLVSYAQRQRRAFVSFDGVANDGEPGEGDNVGTDVEDFAVATGRPSAPTTVRATAGRGLATVTWAAPADNGGAAITGYTITSTPEGRTASTGPEARSATVTGLNNGTTYTFTVTAGNSAGTSDASAPSNAVTPADPSAGQGYAFLGDDGGVFTFGGARNLGSIPGLGLKLNQPPIGMAYTPTGNGYWVVAQDGGIFSFGDARFFGSMGGAKLNAPVLGMEPTPTGNGYWLFGADGGIFSFGDATFFGSTGGIKLNAPMIGMAATSTGKGYWLVAQDGGIFAFGDAKFFGSMGASKLNQPVFDMAPTHDNAGYWLVARDGGIFAFGSAAGKFYGSAANANPATVIGIGTTPTGNGYWIADRNGVVYAFGDAQALGDLRGLGKTAVSFAALPKQP